MMKKLTVLCLVGLICCQADLVDDVRSAIDKLLQTAAKSTTTVMRCVESDINSAIDHPATLLADTCTTMAAYYVFNNWTTPQLPQLLKDNAFLSDMPEPDTRAWLQCLVSTYGGDSKNMRIEYSKGTATNPKNVRSAYALQRQRVATSVITYVAVCLISEEIDPVDQNFLGGITGLGVVVILAILLFLYIKNRRSSSNSSSRV
jgi:hypothetical protein